MAEMTKMTDFVAIRCVFQAPNTPKRVFCRGSAPDPAGGAYDAPPDPLVGWGGDTPSPFPSPLTPLASRSRRFRRLGCQAPNTNSWLRLWIWPHQKFWRGAPYET